MINPTKELDVWCRKQKIQVLKYPRTMSRDLGLFKCYCGDRYKAKANYVLKSIGCQKCVRENAYRKLAETNTGKVSKKKLTHVGYVSRLADERPTIKCLGKYVGFGTKIKFKCTVCGYTTDREPMNALKFGCAECSGNKPKTTSEYNAELRQKEIHFECISYEGSRTSIVHTCTLCNKFTVSVPPTNALRIGKLGCPICDSGTVYCIETADRVFRLRGFERFVLPKLLAVYEPDEIFEDLSGKVPTIKLADGRLHKPDFYIPRRNLLIEVKSTATLGLGRPFPWSKNAFTKTKAKKQAAVAAGYKYMLALMTNSGRRIPIPKDWESYSKSDLEAHISSRGFKLQAST